VSVSDGPPDCEVRGRPIHSALRRRPIRQASPAAFGSQRPRAVASDPSHLQGAAVRRMCAVTGPDRLAARGSWPGHALACGPHRRPRVCRPVHAAQPECVGALRGGPRSREPCAHASTRGRETRSPHHHPPTNLVEGLREAVRRTPGRT
jgi:hypothetical protein